MPVADQFAIANEEYVKSLSLDEKKLGEEATLRTIVVTCMDPRIDVFRAYNIKLGSVFVIRNAGGRAADALRSIIVCNNFLRAQEIAIYHHTHCGMGPPSDGSNSAQLTDEGARRQLKASAPGEVAASIDQLALLSYTDIEESVREDVRFLRKQPLLRDVTVSGWIHDLPVDVGDIHHNPGTIKRVLVDGDIPELLS